MASFPLFSNQEGHFQALLVVQPRIAIGVVIVMQLAGMQPFGSSDTFGHVITCKLKMHASQVTALVAVDGKRLAYFGDDIIKITGFDIVFRCKRIAMHGITAPHYRHPFMLDLANEVWQSFFHLIFAKPADKYNFTLFVYGIQPVNQLRSEEHTSE